MWGISSLSVMEPILHASETQSSPLDHQGQCVLASPWTQSKAFYIKTHAGTWLVLGSSPTCWLMDEPTCRWPAGHFPGAASLCWVLGLPLQSPPTTSSVPWELAAKNGFTANRWGNNGNSDRLYFLGLQNHCRW